jgi:hypothetical protein
MRVIGDPFARRLYPFALCIMARQRQRLRRIAPVIGPRSGIPDRTVDRPGTNQLGPRLCIVLSRSVLAGIDLASEKKRRYGWDTHCVPEPKPYEAVIR